MTIAAANTASVPWAALLPIIVLAVGFVVYCLIDVARSRVRYLPKWVWVIICLISVPVGGIIYLIVGRDHGDGSS